MTPRFLALLALVALPACATSPLYVDASNRQAGTRGEVPRDGSGEPIWTAIAPPPVVAAPPPGLTVNPGVPITQAPGAGPN